MVTLITTSRKTVLEQKRDRDWETICSAPCQRREDPKLDYRVGGRGLYPSQPFRLPAGAQQVEIKASMGSKGARVAGTIMTIGGLLSLAVNGLVLAATDETGSYGEQKVDTSPLVGAMILGGIVAVVGMMLSGGAQTRVVVQDHLSPPAPPAE